MWSQRTKYDLLLGRFVCKDIFHLLHCNNANQKLFFDSL